jgi:Flp pilus assembly protein TadD
MGRDTMTMPGPTHPASSSSEGREQHVREALATLEAARITPLTRPRVLAATRALGYTLSLPDWYSSAWDLEQAGDYTRRGDGEGEWLERGSASLDADDARLALLARPWMFVALRTELQRLHDNAALRALAEALEETHEAEAEHCLHAICETDPDNVDALIALGRLLARRGDLMHARRHVEHVLRIAPDDLQAQVLLANVLDDLQLFTLARDRYQRAIELAPDSAVVHYNFGALLLRDGLRDEAERHLRRACTLAPDDAAMLTTLAIAVVERGDLGEGEKMLRRALALDPGSVRAQRQYGLLLARGRRAAS